MTGERDAVPVAELDALDQSEASALLESCCGSGEWVRRMLARRPFGTMRALVGAADEIWWSLAPEDWKEAFAHHPRIGERAAALPRSARAADWSEREQGGASGAGVTALAALAEGNEAYERRFGYIYVVCATGKTAPEMLALLRERLRNDPGTELRVAAAEQAKITRLRLLKLVGADT